MRTIGKITFAAYLAAWILILLLYPLILKHGYREWWFDWFLGGLACAAIGGNISYYRMHRRNRHP